MSATLLFPFALILILFLFQSTTHNKNETKTTHTTTMTQSKDQKIADVQANLPLPEEPPRASDWQSADATTVNVGAGKTEGSIGTDSAAQAGLRGPSTAGSDMDMSSIGRQGKEGLSETPKDAAK
jgi:hypothetical protein